MVVAGYIVLLQCLRGCVVRFSLSSHTSHTWTPITLSTSRLCPFHVVFVPPRLKHRDTIPANMITLHHFLFQNELQTVHYIAVRFSYLIISVT